MSRCSGRGPPDTLIAAANLAIAFYDAFRFAEAISLQRWVFATTQDVLGRDHLDTVAAKVNLAVTLADAGQLPEAIMLERQVIEDTTQLFGSDDPKDLGRTSGFSRQPASSGTSPRSNRAAGAAPLTLSPSQRRPPP